MITDRNGLKVILISPLPPPAGGIATWTKRFLALSKKNNLEVEIIDSSLIGKRAKIIGSKRNMFEEIYRTKTILSQVKEKIKKLNPEIVHLNTSCGKYGIIRDYLCAKIAKDYGINLIIHFHCNIEDQISNKIQKYFLRKLTELSSYGIVLNKYSQVYLKKEYAYKSKIINNFLDESYYSMRITKQFKSKIDTVLFVGHVQESKGINELLKAAEVLPEIKFIIAGPICIETNRFMNNDNIHFLGALEPEKVIELMQKSDIFLLPTHTEGFSMALLEAMAMGMPVITTDVGANVDMIEEFGGLIVKRNNINQIVSAIKSLENPLVRKRMSIWNIEKVNKYYLSSNVYNDILCIYKSVLKNKKSIGGS